MAQHAAKKGGGVEHEPGPGSQSNNRPITTSNK